MGPYFYELIHRKRQENGTILLTIQRTLFSEFFIRLYPCSPFVSIREEKLSGEETSGGLIFFFLGLVVPQVPLVQIHNVLKSLGYFRKVSYSSPRFSTVYISWVVSRLPSYTRSTQKKQTTVIVKFRRSLSKVWMERKSEEILDIKCVNGVLKRPCVSQIVYTLVNIRQPN